MHDEYYLSYRKKKKTIPRHFSLAIQRLSVVTQLYIATYMADTHKKFEHSEPTYSISIFIGYSCMR